MTGLAILYETNTEEHRKSELRDKEDRLILEKLLGGKKDFVELHENCLKKRHRGKGYWEKFFGFFEELIKSKAYASTM